MVTEGASVHDSDWPYERAPLAQRCAAGWRAIADACHDHGALVIASLDHAGGQGSSAYSQLPLLGTVEGPRGQQPRDAEVDGARRHRRGDRRVRRRGRRSPPAPDAMVSRSTPASTAWCASSCRASPTIATTSGVRID